MPFSLALLAIGHGSIVGVTERGVHFDLDYASLMSVRELHKWVPLLGQLSLPQPRRGFALRNFDFLRHTSETSAARSPCPQDLVLGPDGALKDRTNLCSVGSISPERE